MPLWVRSAGLDPESFHAHFFPHADARASAQIQGVAAAIGWGGDLGSAVTALAGAVQALGPDNASRALAAAAERAVGALAPPRRRPCPSSRPRRPRPRASPPRSGPDRRASLSTTMKRCGAPSTATPTRSSRRETPPTLPLGRSYERRTGSRARRRSPRFRPQWERHETIQEFFEVRSRVSGYKSRETFRPRRRRPTL
jgi:hypothetical protein